jgi:TPR repeat protein
MARRSLLLLLVAAACGGRARGVDAPTTPSQAVSASPSPSGDCQPFSLDAFDPSRPCACGEEAACVARCEGGSAEACVQLGGCYAGFGKLGKDPAKYVKYSTRGCDLGDPTACNNLAEAYATGFGVPRDPARAAALYERCANDFRSGCERGAADDCYMLGHAYTRGLGVAADPSLAATAQERACALGHTFSCVLLATDAKSAGKTSDEARLFGVVCERTCSLGCKEVAELLHGGDPSAQKVTAAWRDRCSRGDRVACRSLGASEPSEVPNSPAHVTP